MFTARTLFAFVSVSVLVALGTGCAASAEETTTDSASAIINPTLLNPSLEGTFKLYSDVESLPTADCDPHTVLELVYPSRSGAIEARLQDVVSGTCKLLIAPDARSYALKLASTECGSRVYTGHSLAGDKRQITVTDNRDRTCRDLVVRPQIVTEETDAKASARTLLSDDQTAAAAK